MNNVILMGRLVKDPELKISPSKKNYVKFTLAVKRTYAKDGADFINCVAWGKTAENICIYLSKGSRLIVNGSLQVTKTETQGQASYFTNVSVNTIQFVDSAGATQANTNETTLSNDNEFQQAINKIKENDEYYDDDNEFPF